MLCCIPASYRVTDALQVRLAAVSADSGDNGAPARRDRGVALEQCPVDREGIRRPCLQRLEVRADRAQVAAHRPGR